MDVFVKISLLDYNKQTEKLPNSVLETGLFCKSRLLAGFGNCSSGWECGEVVNVNVRSWIGAVGTI